MKLTILKNKHLFFFQPLTLISAFKINNIFVVFLYVCIQAFTGIPPSLLGVCSWTNPAKIELSAKSGGVPYPAALASGGCQGLEAWPTKPPEAPKPFLV